MEDVLPIVSVPFSLLFIIAMRPMSLLTAGDQGQQSDDSAPFQVAAFIGHAVNLLSSGSTSSRESGRPLTPQINMRHNS